MTRRALTPVRFLAWAIATGAVVAAATMLLPFALAATSRYDLLRGTLGWHDRRNSYIGYCFRNPQGEVVHFAVPSGVDAAADPNWEAYWASVAAKRPWMFASFEAAEVGRPLRAMTFTYNTLPNEDMGQMASQLQVEFNRAFPRAAIENVSWVNVGLNTAFYAVLTGFVLLFIRWRRRQARRARGMCTECGYSVEGNVSGKCPECGHEIRTEDSRPVGQKS